MNFIDQMLILCSIVVMIINTRWAIFISTAPVGSRVLWWVLTFIFLLWFVGMIRKNYIDIDLIWEKVRETKKKQEITGDKDGQSRN